MKKIVCILLIIITIVSFNLTTFAADDTITLPYRILNYQAYDVSIGGWSTYNTQQTNCVLPRRDKGYSCTITTTYNSLEPIGGIVPHRVMIIQYTWIPIN